MQPDEFGGTAIEVCPLEFRSYADAFAEPIVNAAAEMDEYARFIEHYDSMPLVDVEQVAREAREQAKRETAQTLEEQLRCELERERAQIAKLLQQFESEKQRYFAEVEQEVVRLSLAIAERVLHREVQMDPMLLAGAARVALQQVAEGSEAVLKVPVDQVPSWTEAMAGAAENVIVQPDPNAEQGEATLETRSGTVHLGIRAQLEEIERGFFSLLNRRPVLAS